MKKVKSKAHGPRPVKVLYYRSARQMPHDYDRHGHCKTEAGVMRGAMVRLFMREFELARIYYDGINTMTIHIGANGLPVARFGPHVLGVVRPDGTIKYGT